MKIKELLDSLPGLERERLLGRIEGMEIAMRVCRNRAADCHGIRDAANMAQPHWTVRADEAYTLASVIRLVQVQIGSGRQQFGELAPDELEEIERIY